MSDEPGIFLTPLELEGNEAFYWNLSTGLSSGKLAPHIFMGAIPQSVSQIRDWFRKERDRGGCFWFINRLGIHGFCGLLEPAPIPRSWKYYIHLTDEEARGKGYGVAATKMVLEIAFKRLNAHRVWLDVNAENVEALRCYEKAGFAHEGTFREATWVNGEYRDMCRYAVLEGDRK